MLFATDRTDNFGGGISGNWTNPGEATFSAFTAVSSAIGCSGNCNMYWTADTFQNDQYSQAVVSGTASVGDQAVLNRGSTSTDRFYMCYWAHNGSTDYALFRRDPGSFTNLQSYGTGLVAGGDTIKISVTGTTFTCSINGTGQSPTKTDATYASGTVGLLMLSGSGGAALDDWLGGPITGGGGTPGCKNGLLLLGSGCV